MKTDTLRNWVEQGDYPPSVLHQFFSDCIKAHQALQIETFREGAPAAELIRQRSDFMDEILALAFGQFLADHGDQIALAAVGGYGRQELHPHSDIDILLLRESASPAAPETAAALEAKIVVFLGFLWDIGLKLA